MKAPIASLFVGVVSKSLILSQMVFFSKILEKLFQRYSFQVEIPNCHLAPRFEKWSEWSPCSASCDLGSKTRSRKCTAHCDSAEHFHHKPYYSPNETEECSIIRTCRKLKTSCVVYVKLSYCLFTQGICKIVNYQHFIFCCDLQLTIGI